ncbi:unnamed protein product [Pelagomonas calceolata]|uniref:Uncharacterized protein n=1 Tax=Pelagomonas calceolata TaxID=35677 RepID=A0A8J2WTW0_9STRA|nr:unnamed protein product [Pelagomonas calceolata]
MSRAAAFSATARQERVAESPSAGSSRQFWGSARASARRRPGSCDEPPVRLTEATSFVQILRASPTRPFRFEGASPRAASRASLPRRGSIRTATQLSAWSVALRASALAIDDKRYGSASSKFSCTNRVSAAPARRWCAQRRFVAAVVLNNPTSMATSAFSGGSSGHDRRRACCGLAGHTPLSGTFAFRAVPQRLPLRRRRPRAAQGYRCRGGWQESRRSAKRHCCTAIEDVHETRAARTKRVMLSRTTQEPAVMASAGQHAREAA